MRQIRIALLPSKRDTWDAEFEEAGQKVGKGIWLFPEHGLLLFTSISRMLRMTVTCTVKEWLEGIMEW